MGCIAKLFITLYLSISLIHYGVVQLEENDNPGITQKYFSRENFVERVQQGPLADAYAQATALKNQYKQHWALLNFGVGVALLVCSSGATCWASYITLFNLVMFGLQLAQAASFNEKKVLMSAFHVALQLGCSLLLCSLKGSCASACGTSASGVSNGKNTGKGKGNNASKGNSGNQSGANKGGNKGGKNNRNKKKKRR